MFELGALHTNINGLCPGRLQLSLGLLDIDLGGKASQVTIFGQLQRVLVLNNRRLQQLLFGVQATRSKVIECQVGMEAEIQSGEISSAGLGLGTERFDIPAHASPNVRLVPQFQGQLKIIKGNAVEAGIVRWTIIGIPGAVGRRSSRNRRVVVSSLDAQE